MPESDLHWFPKPWDSWARLVQEPSPGMRDVAATGRDALSSDIGGGLSARYIEHFRRDEYKSHVLTPILRGNTGLTPCCSLGPKMVWSVDVPTSTEPSSVFKLWTSTHHGFPASLEKSFSRWAATSQNHSRWELSFLWSYLALTKMWILDRY